MAFSLSRRASAAGYRLAVFETIGSTSEEGLARARTGEGGALWLVSSEQSAGRGRRGNGWQTPRGNLAASLLIVANMPAPMMAQLGFVAGLALAGALDQVARSTVGVMLRSEAEPRVSRHAGDRDVRASRRAFGAPQHDGVELYEPSPFTLKWPNDVLAGGRKLAGILLQTEALPSGGRAIVVGMGVNVRHVPKGVAYPTTSLHELGIAVAAENLFEALTGEWLEAIGIWDDGRDFAAVRRAWLARAAGLSGPVAVRLRDDVLQGSFETIDEQGQLVIRAGDGTLRHVSAGEVHFGAAATARPEVRA